MKQERRYSQLPRRIADQLAKQQRDEKFARHREHDRRVANNDRRKYD